MLTKVINIDDIIGVRYRDKGRDKNGYDCYGLAMEVSKRFGNELPEVSNLALSNEKEREKIIASLPLEKKSKPTEPGDLLLINNKEGFFSHIAVYLGDERFIHCNLFGVHLNKIKEYKDRIGRVYGWQK